MPLKGSPADLVELKVQSLKFKSAWRFSALVLRAA